MAVDGGASGGGPALALSGGSPPKKERRTGTGEKEKEPEWKKPCIIKGETALLLQLLTK